MFNGAGGSPGDGPYVVLQISIDGDRLGSGDFKCNGCPAAFQAANAVLRFANGRTLSQAALLESKDMEVIAGPLAEGKGFYYALAVDALHACISAASGRQS